MSKSNLKHCLRIFHGTELRLLQRLQQMQYSANNSPTTINATIVPKTEAKSSKKSFIHFKFIFHYASFFKILQRLSFLLKKQVNLNQNINKKKAMGLNAHARNAYFWAKSTVVYLSIGSNLGDRLLHLQLAVGMIAYRIEKSRAFRKWWKTPASGFEGKPFTMLVWRWRLRFAQEEVLTQLLEIEEFLGRKRSEKTGTSREPSTWILSFTAITW